jgi:2-keto-3-deoxy-L-rhamnonate aldolase RhmA
MASLKKRLADGELVLSSMISEMRNPALGRMLATAGLDSMIIDMEHGMFGYADMAAMVSVARGSGMEPVVRVPETRRETILKPLDAGASGILVPMVNSAEEAREAVRLAKYPPAGVRGVALRRGHSDYRAVAADGYLGQANEEIAVLVQIETQEAVDRVEEISGVEGVDAVFVGPFDLSVDMGIPGKINDPRIREAFSGVMAAAKGAGITMGIQLFDPDQARELIEEGVRYLSFGSDVNSIIDTAARNIKDLRPAVPAAS